jgi:hypothetical protein
MHLTCVAAFHAHWLQHRSRRSWLKKGVNAQFLSNARILINGIASNRARIAVVICRGVKEKNLQPQRRSLPLPSINSNRNAVPVRFGSFTPRVICLLQTDWYRVPVTNCMHGGVLVADWCMGSFRRRILCEIYRPTVSFSPLCLAQESHELLHGTIFAICIRNDTFLIRNLEMLSDSCIHVVLYCMTCTFQTLPDMS